LSWLVLWPIWISSDRGVVTVGRMEGKSQTDREVVAGGGAESTAKTAEKTKAVVQQWVLYPFEG